MKLRKSILLPSILATALALSAAPPLTAAENPFVTAMRQMMLFFTLMNGLNANQGGMNNPFGLVGQPFAGNPWTQGYNPSWTQQPPWTTQAYGLAPPPAPTPAPHLTPQPLDQLQGRWFARNGAMLVIREGLARLYASASDYQNFYLRANNRLITFRDAQTGNISTYEYTLDDLGLQLTNDTGGVIEFRQPRRQPSFEVPAPGPDHRPETD